MSLCYHSSKFTSSIGELRCHLSLDAMHWKEYMAVFNAEVHTTSGEALDNREPSAIKSVRDFLSSYGILLEDIKAIPSDDRPAYLIDRLFSGSDIKNLTFEYIDNFPAPSDIGLIVVKPELYAYISRIEDFLAMVGIESKRLPTVDMSEHEWLSVYGHKLSDAPDIINLYITQRALGMTPIIFRHLALEDYLDYAARFGIDTSIISNPDDLTEVFDKIFCGSSDQQSNGSLRWDVTRSSLESSGFHYFKGEAEAFDSFNFYREGHEDYVYKVFNGVHLPSNESELRRNLGIFLK